MDIPSLLSANDAGDGPSKACQSGGHNFMLRVQGAVGPKSISGYGIEGRVLVSFSLGNDGALKTVRIARSSGHDELDRAAIQIVGAAAFPTPPTGLSMTQRTYVSAFSFS